MSYQVPRNIDNNKVFIVNRSEIENRLDPLYYGSDFTKFFKHPYSVRLKDVCINFSSGFGAGKNEQTTKDNGYIQIRPTNIDNDGFLKYEKNVYVPLHKGVPFVKKGTVLFNNTNSQEWVGKTALLQEDSKLYTSNHITSIIVNYSKVISEYLWIVLNIYQRNKVFYSICTNWNNQSGVGIDLLQSVKVPIPPISSQQEIVDYYISAYNEKQEREIEAQQLLDSIDTYLLDELGVSLPEVRNELKDRVFLLNRSELEGRFDPTVYKDGIKLISSKWDNEKLSKVAFVNPGGAYKGKTADTPISFVPMEVIDETFSEITTMDETTIEQASGFTKFREGDLLWAKITPCMQNGKSAIAKNLTNGLGCGSTEFFILRPKDERLVIEYLHVILHMKCVRETAMLYFGGSAGQQRVPASFLENFNIPLPPKEKQIEIANHVYELRQKAKTLQEEGKRILESAKQEVERMIMLT
jgi:type I restriction enzyme S subunit